MNTLNLECNNEQTVYQVYNITANLYCGDSESLDISKDILKKEKVKHPTCEFEIYSQYMKTVRIKVQ